MHSIALKGNAEAFAILKVIFGIRRRTALVTQRLTIEKPSSNGSSAMRLNMALQRERAAIRLPKSSNGPRDVHINIFVPAVSRDLSIVNAPLTHRCGKSCVVFCWMSVTRLHETQAHINFRPWSVSNGTVSPGPGASPGAAKSDVPKDFCQRPTSVPPRVSSHDTSSSDLDLSR